MDEKIEMLHDIRKCLKKFNSDSGDAFSDLVNGAIVGFAIADAIVSGDISVSDKSAEENALGIVAAITLIEALPVSALENIEKMFS